VAYLPAAHVPAVPGANGGGGIYAAASRGQLVLGDIGIPVGVYRRLRLEYSTPFDRRSRVPLRRLP